jgi:glutaredoxin
MKKYLLLFMLLSFLFCETAIADYYKWEDENGNTQITDYPPPQDKAVKNVQIHPKDPSEDLTNLKNEPPKEPDVILYTKNDCQDCDKAREFLQSQNILFTEYNMDNDKDAAVKRKKDDDGNDVPFAVIYKNRVYGFTESVYERALKSKPKP